MDKDALQKTLYGALLELTTDPKYYYYSAVGPQYSELTQHGQQVVLDLVNDFAYNMYRCRVEEDISRSKQLVLDELKDDHSKI